jgi:hypothetical protein
VCVCVLFTCLCHCVLQCSSYNFKEQCNTVSTAAVQRQPCVLHERTDSGCYSMCSLQSSSLRVSYRVRGTQKSQEHMSSPSCNTAEVSSSSSSSRCSATVRETSLNKTPLFRLNASDAPLSQQCMIVYLCTETCKPKLLYPLPFLSVFLCTLLNVLLLCVYCCCSHCCRSHPLFFPLRFSVYV